MRFALSFIPILLLSSFAAQKHVPPDFEKKMEAIKNFESGVAPLFVLGDLNEDGVVDDRDVQLLKAWVEKRTSAGLSCLAGGDLNTDGVVDAKDLALLQKALAGGPVQAPPLSYHSSLPCDYRNFFIAARSGARAGGTVPIHFLNPKFTPQNSGVTVQSGPARVTKTADGYQVQTEKSAPPGSLVTLLITPADGRKYVYSFYVH